MKPHLSSRLFFFGISGLVGVFLVLVILVSVFWWNAQRQLSDINYDSSGMAAVQLRMHFNLMLMELELIEREPETATPADAVLQYDIVYQRLSSLPKRPPYDRILSPELNRIIDTVFSGIKAEEERVDRAISDGVDVLVGMRERLLPYQAEMDRLSGRTTQLAGEFRDVRRQDVLSISQFLIILTVGLMVSGMIFAFLLWRSALNASRQNKHLTELTQELQKVSRAKSEFLAHMSHELRTPLNAIAGFSEMISSQALGKIENDKYLEYAGHIRSSGQHLIEIINDVLDLSKIEAGELVLEPETFAVEGALLDAINLINFRGNRDQDSISVTIDDNAREIYADLRSFRQIVINILSNADKYTPEDGEISVAVRRDSDGSKLVEVTDSGTGIHKDDLARILEPFGQARKNAEVSHDGTGLGLSLSSRLMEMHKGELLVESEFHKGTTVTLRFPRP